MPYIEQSDEFIWSSGRLHMAGSTPIPSASPFNRFGNTASVQLIYARRQYAAKWIAHCRTVFFSICMCVSDCACSRVRGHRAARGSPQRNFLSTLHANGHLRNNEPFIGGSRSMADCVVTPDANYANYVELARDTYLVVAVSFRATAHVCFLSIRACCKNGKEAQTCAC
jgi:hypothetical protein